VTVACVVALCFGVSELNGTAQVRTGSLPNPTLSRHQFSTLDGRRFNLEGLRGQVVVLHFFGTWCGYSKAQARKLHELTEHGVPAGLQIFGLSVKDPLATPQSLRQFIADQHVNYPVVSQVEDDLFSKFVESRDISVPQTLIYGSDGRLVAHFNGYGKQLNEQLFETIRRELGKTQFRRD
jgi:peroxiredoxin